LNSIWEKFWNELPHRKQRGIKEKTDDCPKGWGNEPSPVSGGIKIKNKTTDLSKYRPVDILIILKDQGEKGMFF
jgi:hypothetical protein